VNLVCNAVSGLTCSFSPAQVTLSSGGSSTAVLSIGVTSNPALVSFWPESAFKRGPDRRLLYILFIVAIGFVAWLGIRQQTGVPEASGGKHPWVPQVVFCMLVLLALGISSCGGGGSTTSGGGNPGGGGTVTSVTVQGTAGGTAVSLGAVTVTVK